MSLRCIRCQAPHPDKGRALDGRRTYRCRECGETWTSGWQGMKKQRYSGQRQGMQFAATGAHRQSLERRQHPILCSCLRCTQESEELARTTGLELS